MSSSTPSTSSATSTVLASVSLITLRPRLGSPLVREIPDRPEPTSRTSATSPSSTGSAGAGDPIVPEALPAGRAEAPAGAPLEWRTCQPERQLELRQERHLEELKHWVRQRPEHLRPRREGPRRPSRREGLRGRLSLRARWWCLRGSRVRLR